MKRRIKMKKERIATLTERLNELNFHYYTLDKPLISDKEYDSLYNELVALEKKYPHLKTIDSPTSRVGGEILSGFVKKEHTTKLYSLDKAQTKEDLEKFFTNTLKSIESLEISYTVELKMDGLAIVIRYEDGSLVEARTRGNGSIGEDVTAQVKTIKSIPLKVTEKNVFEVQGEVFMPNTRFHEINNKIESNFRKKIGNHAELSTSEELQLSELLFKTARNATGGSLRNLDTKVTASRGLDAYLYNIPYIENKQFSSQTEMMFFLKEQGFKVNPYFVTFKELSELETQIDEIVKQRENLGYDIDGMVIKVNDTQQRDTLGFTSKHPKWAIAWKFDADQANTVLKEIKIETGRTGKITPVGILNPVQIGNTTVSKATLNNFEWIEERGLKFALGATVTVRRSNDVIPEILGIAEERDMEEIKAPTHCPDCESSLVKDGVHLYCKNIDFCPSQQIEKIIHFTSRDAMNIDTFGEKTAELLWEAGLIKNIADIYNLTTQDLLKLERFGEKKAQKLLNAIESSKQKSLDSFIYALGIRHAGKGTAERLLRYYSNLDDISNANINELKEIENIGETVATSIYEYFHHPQNSEIITQLKNSGLILRPKKTETTSNIFDGMIFVVTGTMPSGKNRTMIKNIIKENGGKVSETISAKTTYLIAGDEAGNKLTKAKKLESQTNRKIILSEKELNDLINK
jgi:DNA ligase (NAD+)